MLTYNKNNIKVNALTRMFIINSFEIVKRIKNYY